MEEGAFDVAVIGAGFGGVYAARPFSQEGHSVVGIDGASDFGGTWYHNGYPGSPSKPYADRSAQDLGRPPVSNP